MLRLNKVPRRTTCTFSVAISIFILFFIALSIPSLVAQAAPKIKLTPLPANIVSVPEQDALVNVFVDGREFWDVSAKLDMDAPFLKIDILKEMLGPSLAAGSFNDIFGVVLSQLEWAGPEDLMAAGFNAAWDMSTLTYKISTPSSFAGLKELDFSPTYAPKGKEIFKPSLFSSAVNFSSSSDVKFSPAASFSQDLYIDGLIKIWDIAVEGGGSFIWMPTQTSASLSKARLVYDIPGIGGRFLVGKITAETMSYQSTPEILGISLNSISQFSRYDRLASPSVAFTLDNPSTVRIVINGLPVRETHLDRGKYRIYDLPFSSGLNTLEVYVTDNTGIKKLLKPSEAYIAAEGGILVSGQSEYGFAAGAGYDSPDQPFASGSIRYGLDYKITLSAFAQGDARSFLGGFAVIGGTDIGILSAEAASVVAWDGRASPFSYAANLRYQVSIPSKQEFPSFTLTAEYLSGGFTPPKPTNAAIDVNDAKAGVTASIGGVIAKALYYSATASWERTFGSSFSDTSGASLNFGYNTGKGVSIALNSGITFKTGSQPAPSLSITAYIKPNRRPNATLSFTQSADSQNMITYSDRLDNLGGIEAGMQLYDIMPGSPERTMLSSSLRKLTDFGDLSLRDVLNYGGSTGTVDGSVSLKATTALVFAGGTFALSRPVYDSFIILAPDATIGSKKVTLTASSSGTVTAMKMPSVLSISSYKQTTARADFPDSDADIVSSIPESVLSPGYRSGILYRVGIEKLHSVIGRLVNQQGKPYAYVAGDVFDPEGGQVESIFTYEDGTFQVYTIMPGKYRIEWPQGIGISYITIPKGAGAIIELGDITAEEIKE